MRQLLSALGYRTIDDAIEFVMAGLALLPPFLFLTGNVVAGALSLIVLIILLAAIGMRAPPPPVPPEHDAAKKGEPKPHDSL